MPGHSHAYIAIFDGTCQAVCVDCGDKGTAEFVSRMIREGGTIERVPMEIARKALLEPWPLAD
jgi:hypothetical protein